MTIATSIETITPQTSFDWLNQNTANRPQSRVIVEKYAAAMSRGEWKLTGEPIIFDTNNVLSNGQHRLEACVVSGCSFTTVVVRGVAPDAFEAMDSGKGRTASDVLSVSGEVNYIPLASGARAYVQQLVTGRAKDMITSPQIKAAVQVSPRLRFWTGEFVNCRPRLFPALIIGLLTRAEELYGFGVIGPFAQAALTGQNLSAGDPALVLRARFMDRSGGVNLSQRYATAFITKAINAHVQGRKISILRFKESEAVPEFVRPLAA